MRSENRILTTHVGSLVRPDALLDVLRRLEEGDRTAEKEFPACVDRCVDEVVKRQVDTGIDIVSDGEFTKTSSWSRYVLGRMNGLRQRADVPPRQSYRGKDRQAFAAFYAEYEKPLPGGMRNRADLSAGPWVVEGPVSYKGHAELRADAARLKSSMAKAGAFGGFLPVVAPVSATPNLVDQHYGDPKKLLYAFADALREEYRLVADEGLFVQVDDAHLAALYDSMVPEKPLSEYRKWAEMGIDALNHALQGIPEDRVRFHICWGSWNGPHTNDVNMRDIVDLLLKVRAGGYSVEMANPRHEHEWRVWETVKLPKGRVLLPGVISHATNIVEHPELVAERLVRLAQLVGRENVIASTDCGFSQGPFMRRVHESIMWAKLESLVEGARLASRTLWGSKAA